MQMDSAGTQIMHTTPTYYGKKTALLYTYWHPSSEKLKCPTLHELQRGPVVEALHGQANLSVHWGLVLPDISQLHGMQAEPWCNPP